MRWLLRLQSRLRGLPWGRFTLFALVLILISVVVGAVIYSIPVGLPGGDPGATPVTGKGVSPNAAQGSSAPATFAVPATDTPDQPVQVFLHQYPRSLYAVTGHDTSWQVVLSNTGSITLYNTVARDALVPGCNRTFSVLPPGSGQWWTCTVHDVTSSFDNYMFTRAYPLTGTYAADEDNDAITAISPSDRPSILINQDAARVMVLHGANAHFWMSIINNGPITLTNVVVSDPVVPQCDGYNLAQLAPYAVNYYYCEQPTPKASFASTTTVTARVANGGASTTVVSATSVSHIVMGNFVLTGGYESVSSTVQAGDALSFVEGAINLTSPAATGVVMTATVPWGTTFIGVQNGTFSSTLGSSGSPGVYWSGDVPGDASYFITLTVRVDQVTGTVESLGRVTAGGEEISYEAPTVNVVTPHTIYAPSVTNGQ